MQPTVPVSLVLLALAATAAFGEDVTLTTTDGWQLPATVWAPGGKARSGRGVVLLHTYNHTRSDWKSVAERLQKEGHVVLALDLRGHGKSKRGGKPVPVKGFAEADFAAMVEDARAAAEYLLSRKDLGVESLYFVGAGLGANVAVLFAAAGGETPVNGLVLLSPHLDDHGLKLEEAIQKVEARVLLAACREDHPGFEDAGRLFELKHGKREFERFAKGLQGTEILGKFPELMDSILRFIGEP